MVGSTTLMNMVLVSTTCKKIGWTNKTLESEKPWRWGSGWGIDGQSSGWFGFSDEAPFGKFGQSVQMFNLNLLSSWFVSFLFSSFGSNIQYWLFSYPLRLWGNSTVVSSGKFKEIWIWNCKLQHGKKIPFILLLLSCAPFYIITKRENVIFHRDVLPEALSSYSTLSNDRCTMWFSHWLAQTFFLVIDAEHLFTSTHQLTAFNFVSSGHPR